MCVVTIGQSFWAGSRERPVLNWDAAPVNAAVEKTLTAFV